MAPARGVGDTHLLKNLKGENMMTTVELSCSRMEQELASVKRRQRQAESEAEDIKTQSILAKIKTIASTTTESQRHEFGKTPGGLELMKLFGAKRQPSDVHADCKNHVSKLKADLAHQKMAFEREIVAHERIRVSQANEIAELHTLAAIAKEDAAQGTTSLQRQVSDLELNLRTNKLLKDGLELELSDLRRTLTELKSTMASAEVDSKGRSSNLESEVSNLKICLNDAWSQARRAKEDLHSITGHMMSANENHVTVLKEAHTEALLEEQRRLVNVHQSELCSLKLQLQKEYDILSTTALLEQQSRLSAQHHAAVTSLEEQNNSSIKALEERKHSELECLKTNMMDEKDRELAELGSKLDEEHEFKYGQLKSRMAREYSEKSLALQIELNAEKDAALEQQCKVLRQNGFG